MTNHGPKCNALLCINPVCDRIIELMEPLSRRISTGNWMLLAMTCHTLYFAVLGHLRARIHESVKRPFGGQTIFMMWCPHRCDPTKQTAFVYGHSKQMRCTHCLYCFRPHTNAIPTATWWIVPVHETMVAEIMNTVGARHALLMRV